MRFRVGQTSGLNWRRASVYPVDRALATCNRHRMSISTIDGPRTKADWRKTIKNALSPLSSEDIDRQCM